VFGHEWVSISGNIRINQNSLGIKRTAMDLLLNAGAYSVTIMVEIDGLSGKS
jgi:hypothetical protein